MDFESRKQPLFSQCTLLRFTIVVAKYTCVHRCANTLYIGVASTQSLAIGALSARAHQSKVYTTVLARPWFALESLDPMAYIGCKIMLDCVGSFC